jgi:hypothetical protein
LNTTSNAEVKVHPKMLWYQERIKETADSSPKQETHINAKLIAHYPSQNAIYARDKSQGYGCLATAP